MNEYIDAQCKQMIAMVRTFEHTCEVAARKDDGIVSTEEEKALKKIHAAGQKYIAQLSKI